MNDHQSPTVHFTVWVGYLALCVGMFMAILDIQIVASSLPAIQTALHIKTSNLSWIQTAYLIAEIIAIPLTGWLTRLLSLRWLFVAAVIGFSAASIGCAASIDFEMLLIFRIVQGFCGGSLIPIVFTSVFVLFPEHRHVLATTIGGLFAMLAPTVGPVMGGYITQFYSWHWLFLINIAPGLMVTVLAFRYVRIGNPDWGLWKQLDALSLLLITLCLASLEMLLKEGPPHHWRGSFIVALVILFPATGVAAIRRCLRKTEPVIDMRCFASKRFIIGCFYSFVLGMGLFGSVYLMPLYLGFVRQHMAFEIGKIMMVMGAAQLIMAPIAAFMEKRIPTKWLIALGYGLFSAGLFANGFMTYATDFQELFWPQIFRGAAVLFCLLPTTVLALNHLPTERLANASGLFNLMRNLGGAIGIALIDTILEQRTSLHAAHLATRLQTGDVNVLNFIGLPADSFSLRQAGDSIIVPLIQRAALVMSFNEAWLMLGTVFAFAAIVPLSLNRIKLEGGYEGK